MAHMKPLASAARSFCWVCHAPVCVVSEPEPELKLDRLAALGETSNCIPGSPKYPKQWTLRWEYCFFGILNSCFGHFGGPGTWQAGGAATTPLSVRAACF